jgi:voltage-gated potassium channel
MIADSRNALGAVRLPREDRGPLRLLIQRLGIAAAMILFVALVAYLGRGGYSDDNGGEISFLDALYYASVSVTTTGYGDITPVTDGARLATTLLVTPARVLFLLLLVGTTVEILTERSRHVVRLRRWSRRLRDHVIICGYGTKGRSAAEALIGRGFDRSRIVVIDGSAEAIARASGDGYAVVHGSAASAGVLEQAGAERASAVVVAPDRDDTSVLITLTARELNREGRIVAAVREAENAHLLRESGADSVITSSAAAGRLLGTATQSPESVELVEDLLDAGSGMDLVERPVREDETGPKGAKSRDELVVAVVRDGEVIRFDDPRLSRLEPGDRVVSLRVNR